MFGRPRLDDIRARPKEEKTAIAASIALGVVAILFIGWLVYVFQSIRNAPAPDFGAAANQLDTDQLQQVQQQVAQEYGSTTQFIESEGGVQLEQLGTSTYTDTSNFDATNGVNTTGASGTTQYQ